MLWDRRKLDGFHLLNLSGTGPTSGATGHTENQRYVLTLFHISSTPNALPTRISKTLVDSGRWGGSLLVGIHTTLEGTPHYTLCVLLLRGMGMAHSIGML